jgi:hypothetical protein
VTASAWATILSCRLFRKKVSCCSSLLLWYGL